MTSKTVHPNAYESRCAALTAALNLYLKAGNSFRVAQWTRNRASPRHWSAGTSHDREIALEYGDANSNVRLSAYRLDVANEIH